MRKLQKSGIDFIIAFYSPGFDLTFKKWFVSFPKKLTAKLILNVAYHGWARNSIFHSRLLETVLSRIFLFTFLSNWKNTRFASYTRQVLLTKIIVLKNCIKYNLKIFLIEFCRISHTQKKWIISASIKTWQIKLLLSSAAK